ncbi:2-amino-4-hydroxy-6-hydroxymethyldihydropteridine diphosphokinase [Flavobacteriaceae bacterium Ap0902]|nr:2-amino-4-hydroxy-6-hydroxymethyldihydropteridine diphosphokinase [Flavobacteriaceae bacterium Ap0902]
MTQYKTILLLGTDLGDKKNNLIQAKSYINRYIGQVIKETKIIETEPIGFTSDTTFLNQVVEVETSFSPFLLLKAVKRIENEMGRVYHEPKQGEAYTSRIIDIDILFYENLKVNSSKLTIPHNQIKTRAFVTELMNDEVFTSKI